jgi:predicted RNase H-like HicB family nuclease
MLTEYIRAAMRRATYEKFDDGTYYGEIPGIQGVYANEATLEGCRDELQSALEDWLVFSLANNLSIPSIDGIELVTTKVA